MITRTILLCPVPSASTYISTLPVTAYPHLDLELDQDHNGVELDLSEIASHMRKWEEKLSSALGLTHIDVEDIKAIHRDRPELQRYDLVEGMGLSYSGMT